MKRRMGVVLAAIFFCGLLSYAGTADAQATDLPAAGRALSLRALQQELESCHSERIPPYQARRLGDITQLLGYVVDQNTHDVVLFGETDPTAPALHTDDFIVALRNAWLEYAEVKGHSIYYSYPGCSIDPDPGVMRDLQDLAGRITPTSDDSRVENMLREWTATCEKPQQVRVMGIPFDSRFAWVMVEADYAMKSLVDGSDDSLSIVGFKSLLGMTMDEAKRQLNQGTRTRTPLSAMNRFWFHPGESICFADGMTTVVLDCPVTLLTEEEHLAARGGFVGSGRANPRASQFCARFSSLYDQLSEQRPIYAELANLFRLVAVTQLMKEEDASSAAAFDMGYLLEEHRVGTTAVPRSLPGRSNVMTFSQRRAIQGGYSEAYLWLPSCGGVSIEFDPKRARRPARARTRQRCISLGTSVLQCRPAPGSLSWGWQMPAEEKSEIDGVESDCDLYALFDRDPLSRRGVTASKGE